VALELFANQPSTTVSSGGTDAPSAGTVETWTVASSATFPAVSSTASPPAQFHVADASSSASSELIAVTNISGTTWTVTRGSESTTPVTHVGGFTVYQVVSAGAMQQASRVDWLNAVTMFGADPTGTADSTTAISTAITGAANAGVVYLPAGTYKLTSALAMGSGVTLCGDGPGATILHQTSTTANGVSITGTTVASVQVRDLRLNGPGSGTGYGIYASANSGANPVVQMVLRNLIVYDFGSHGVYAQNAIESIADNVQSVNNLGRGFYLSEGTSVTLLGCYANYNTSERGYYLVSMAYSALVGCAADGNAIGYELYECDTVTIMNSGAEVTAAGSSGLDGSSFKVNACTSTALRGCRATSNAAVGAYFTGTSTHCGLDGFTETAAGGATASIKISAGCSVTVANYVTATAVSYASGTVAIISNNGYSFFPSIEVGGEALFDGTITGNGVTDWLNVVVYGADPTGSADSTSAIQAALTAAAAGQTVYLPTGSYKVSVPLLVPSGVNLTGSKGCSQSGDDAAPPTSGSILVPTSGWAGSYTGVITLASSSNGTHISNLWVNATSAPASVDGIATTGGSGANAVLITGVGVYKATGHGFAAYNGDGWTLDTCLAQNCTGDGFNVAVADSTHVNCHAQSNTADGWNIAANTRLIGCRADLNANGFTVNGADGSGYLDSVQLSGCSTQRNVKYGLNVVNTSATGYGYRDPVIASGCSFFGDGANSGSGGGGYAGVGVSGSNTVTLSGCNVLTGTVDVAGGCPAYAITTATQGSSSAPPTLVQVNGGVLNAITGLINDGASIGAAARITPGTNQVVGTGYQNGSSAVQTYPVQNAEFLGAQQDLFTQPAGCLAATMPRNVVANACSALTSGELYLRGIGIQAGVLCSNLTFVTNTTAKTGGTHGWYVLLDSSFKVRAVTADQTDSSTIWGTASTPYALAFGTAYRTTYSGLYFVGVMVAESGGTMPTFSGSNTSLAGGITGLAPVIAGTSSTGQSTPPAIGATMTTIGSNAGYHFYAFIT
jgi:Pectate lyase superfamily protein/Right handed beta helix region